MTGLLGASVGIQVRGPGHLRDCSAAAAVLMRQQ